MIKKRKSWQFYKKEMMTVIRIVSVNIKRNRKF